LLVLALGVCLLGLVWLLLALRDSTGPGLVAIAATALCTTLMLLGVAALGWHVGVRLTRQRLGEALRAARQQARVLARLQPDWQWATDEHHHLLHWQAPQGAPVSNRAVAGAPLWEQFHDEAAQGELQARLQARADFAELRVRGRAGEAGGEGPWLLRGLACWDGQGRFSGYQGSARLLDATAAVAPVDSEADAELSEHESFSYTISHDLRAPLRVVEGFARILKEDYGRLLDRIGNDHLDRVMGASARMNSMIDALLSLAQLSSQPLARQPVDLSQLAGFIVDELRRGASERAVEVSVQPGLLVQGDPTLLRMLLENLLGNAWKYSGKCERAQIRFEAQRGAQAGGRCVYLIADNGAGFDMRFADRLFGVFQRLHSASDFPGTGIGLASVRRIVRRHGGEIWAESEVGRGARFYFTLAG
jgi:signal transduction histidine kinase